MRYEAKLATMAFAAMALMGASVSAAPVVGTGSVGDPGDTEQRWDVTFGERTTDPFIVNPAISPWVDPVSEGVDAQWINPYPAGGPLFSCVEFCPITDPNATEQDVEYVYTLEFDDPNSHLQITWASDNGAQFFLNDNPVSLDTLGSTEFGSLSTFTILDTPGVFNDGTGTNIFRVVVTNLELNGGNPTGLLVSVVHTPLPPAVLLFGSALLGMGWLCRRRRENKAGPTIRPANG